MHVSVVSIPVSDQDRAKKFYTEVLGFNQLADNVRRPHREVVPQPGVVTGVREAG